MTCDELYESILERSVSLHNALSNLSHDAHCLGLIDSQSSSFLKEQISQAKRLQIDLRELHAAYQDETEYDSSVIEGLTEDINRYKKVIDDFEVENLNLRRTIQELQYEMCKLEDAATYTIKKHKDALDYINDIKHDSDHEYDELSRSVYRLYKRGEELYNDDKHNLEY